MISINKPYKFKPLCDTNFIAGSCRKCNNFVKKEIDYIWNGYYFVCCKCKNNLEKENLIVSDKWLKEGF